MKTRQNQKNENFSVEEAEEILKAAGTEDIFEKAHVHGEVHPNGKWYWDSQAAGGKGDWRVIKRGTSRTTADTDRTRKVSTKEERGEKLSPKKLREAIHGEIDTWLESNKGEHSDTSNFREKLYSLYEKYNKNNPMTINKFNNHFAGQYMDAGEGFKFNLFANARKKGAGKQEAEKYAQDEYNRFLKKIEQGEADDYQLVPYDSWKISGRGQR